MSVPLDDPPDGPPPPRLATSHERWTDIEYAAACSTYHMRRTFYGGEAFPVRTVGYPGHMSIPTFLDCPLDLDFDTGWWYPIVTGEGLAEAVLKLRADRDAASRFVTFHSPQTTSRLSFGEAA